MFENINHSEFISLCPWLLFYIIINAHLALEDSMLAPSMLVKEDQHVPVQS